MVEYCTSNQIVVVVVSQSFSMFGAVVCILYLHCVGSWRSFDGLTLLTGLPGLIYTVNIYHTGPYVSLLISMLGKLCKKYE